MKIDTTSRISAKLTFNEKTYAGTLSFTQDGMQFHPTQISHKSPEVKLDYFNIVDMVTESPFIITTAITVVDKKSNKYKFSTIRAGSIRRYLDNKF